ncbi:MAG TPA: SMP-30/gluconolactonase/LRE family protein [Bacteroidota bacterium]
MKSIRLFHTFSVLLICTSVIAQPTLSQSIPVEVLIENRFNGGEGLSFNHEGRLFICANRSMWEVTHDLQTHKVADFTSNLGLAPIGKRDLLKADFGPLIFPQHGTNNDGVVWRVTPEGDTTRIADNIGDPNAIVVLPDSSFLVSDDFTYNIYHVTPEGTVSVFTDAIPFPNGIALSPNGDALYVARLFVKYPDEPPPARFQEFSDEVWRLPLRDFRPAGLAEVVFRTGGATGPDGLAVDTEGRVYLSAAREGQLWRFDPTTGKGELLAEGLPGLASIAFGQGKFDHESLYAMQIRGGRVLRFKVGAKGARLFQ